jgi:hypothetical protein
MSFVKILGREPYFPSLKDLVCAKITKFTDTKGLSQECVDYRKRKFISLFFVAADDSHTAIAFIKKQDTCVTGTQVSDGRGDLYYDVTSLERVFIVFDVHGCEVKLDLLLCNLVDTLSIAFYDFNIFIKHGETFSVMNVFEGEKHLTL